MLALVLTAAVLGQATGETRDGTSIRTLKEMSILKGFSPVSLGAVFGPPGQLPFTEPDFGQVPAGNGRTGLQCFDPNTEEGVIAQVRTPYGWDIDSNFGAYLVWVSTTGGTGNVRWRLDCTGVTSFDGGVFFPISTLYYTSAAPGTIDTSVTLDLGVFPGTGLGLNSGRLCALARDAADAADTYTGDACVFDVIATFDLASLGNASDFTR